MAKRFRFIETHSVLRELYELPKPLTLKDSPGRGRWHESARRGQGGIAKQ
nr:MAG TPA: hypothetical protein [Caudoviricetes sp.]